MKGRGQILNHGSKELLVLETDSGLPVVHRLGPRRKSPSNVDADGFKRSDGKSILLHSDWWKIPDDYKADVYQIGEDFLIPISVMAPVHDQHFGDYKIIDEIDWGEKLVYVTEILKDGRGTIIGYKLDSGAEIAFNEAIKLATEGRLDNVVVVRNKRGTVFLRSKKNNTADDNLAS